jgi:DNA-binding response OmpR family regulator
VPVLVADDDADIRDLVTLKLEQAGYAVQSVGDGVAALEAIRTSQPRLAILDVT